MDVFDAFVFLVSFPMARAYECIFPLVYLV